MNIYNLLNFMTMNALRYFFTILTMFFLLECQHQETTPAQSNDDLIISLVDGKVTSNLNNSELANFAQRVLLNSGDSNPLLKNGKVLESHLEVDGDYYHLISQFKSEQAGKTIITALEMKRVPTIEEKDGLRVGYNSEDGTFTTNGGGVIPKNTCTGNPCSACAFVKGAGGKIIGCTCNGSSGLGSKCDHTVSE